MKESKYKNTEVGVIPEDWELKELGTILSFGSGRDYKQLMNGEIPVYGTGGVMTYVDEFLYDGESVGIGRKGTIDKPVFLDGKFWTVDTLFYTHQFINANPKFIYYKFCLIKWKEYNEASGVPSLNKNTLQKIKIALPELAEQTAIATALSDADALINSLEKLIAKKRNIKQGAMQKLFSIDNCQLTIDNGGWEVKKLGDFLDYEQPTEYLVTDTEYDNNNQIPVLTAGKTFILGYTNEEHGIFKNLPVIIFDDFTTAIKYVDFPFKAKSSAMKMLLPKNEKVNLIFIYELMLQIKYQVADHKRHWIGEYSRIEIKAPSTQEEQTRIATILSDMDAEIQALETKLEKYRKIKLGMMQNLLTGKIRLV